MHFAALLAFLAALLLPAAAAAQTAQERSRLDWAVERGRLLFELDRAAWVTTDDVLARAPRAAVAEIRGWVVEPDGTGFIVTYYAFGEEDLLHAVYRARVENRRVASAELFTTPNRPLLTPYQRRLVTVREAASSLDRRPCGPNFNTVVIPPATADGPADLYLLTPQTDSAVFPFGGHFRATIAADGSVSDSRAFTNSCLAMPGRPPQGEPAALMVTHLLDPIPTEIHVFLSIWIGVPIYVGTRDRRLWEVTPDSIRLVEAD